MEAAQRFSQQHDPLWVFAYGSLIWRPSFSYEARVRAYVDGYARRFWQASTDHRGVPGSPGRVVTLVPGPEQRCWGVSYRIAADDRQRVLDMLAEREKGGYALQRVTCVAKDRMHSGVIDAVTYIGSPEHPSYAGEVPVEEIAEIVRAAVGPSGHNVEYVLRLADALMELGIVDEHVFQLANHLTDPTGVFESDFASD